MVVQLRRQTKHNLRNVNGRCYRHHTMFVGIGVNTRKRRDNFRNIPDVPVVNEAAPVVVQDVPADVQDVPVVDNEANVADDVIVTVEELEHYFEHYDKITDKSQMEVPKRLINAMKFAVNTSEDVLIDESLLIEYKRLIGICHFVHIRNLKIKSENSNVYNRYLAALNSGNYVHSKHNEMLAEMRRILRVNNKISHYNKKICEKLGKIRFAQSEAFRMKIARN